VSGRLDTREWRIYSPLVPHLGVSTVQEAGIVGMEEGADTADGDGQCGCERKGDCIEYAERDAVNGCGRKIMHDWMGEDAEEGVQGKGR